MYKSWKSCRSRPGFESDPWSFATCWSMSKYDIDKWCNSMASTKNVLWLSLTKNSLFWLPWHQVPTFCHSRWHLLPTHKATLWHLYEMHQAFNYLQCKSLHTIINSQSKWCEIRIGRLVGAGWMDQTNQATKVCVPCLLLFFKAKPWCFFLTWMCFVA